MREQIVIILLDHADSLVIVQLVECFMVQCMSTRLPTMDLIHLDQFVPAELRVSAQFIGIHEVSTPEAELLHDGKSHIVNGLVLIVKSENDDGIR